MDKILILIAILLPIAGGVIYKLFPDKNRKVKNAFLESVVVLTSIIVWSLILKRPTESLVLVSFAKNLTISFKLDGLGSIFAGLISFLWPFATLYAFEYMEKEERENNFFLFYTVTYGVTLGISFAEDLMTMYFFYEMLTLVTVPLVLHMLTRKAIVAGRTYLYYSLGGAAFGFCGFIFAYVYGSDLNFKYGGVLDLAKIGDRVDVLLLVYVLAFLGFGVKAALFPFNKWLPEACVAPTPVTALLHAVAVVKSGAFAIMRLTYFSYGADFVRGTWAQYICITITLLTILYGSIKAVKETHLKRRLAYSTISNLSYILFSISLMSPLGLLGGLVHLVYHAVMKISAFFCAGAALTYSRKEYVHEMDGLGKKMPVTFTIFTISSLAVMGVPGLCGFVSKWYIAKAAVDSGHILGLVGIGVILLSALLTAVYLMTVVVRAFFPEKSTDLSKLDGAHDPGLRMLIPLFVFVILMVIGGLYSEPIINILTDVSFGLF